MASMQDRISVIAHQGINDICEDLYRFATTNRLSQLDIENGLWSDNTEISRIIAEFFKSYTADWPFTGDDFADMDEN